MKRQIWVITLVLFFGISLFGTGQIQAQSASKKPGDHAPNCASVQGEVRCLYTSNGDEDYDRYVYILNLREKGTAGKLILDAEGNEVFFPTWVGNTRFVYMLRRSPANVCSLWIANADGKDANNVDVGGKLLVCGSKLSWTGSELLFSAVTANGSKDVFAKNLATGAERQLTDTPEKDEEDPVMVGPDLLVSVRNQKISTFWHIQKIVDGTYIDLDPTPDQSSFHLSVSSDAACYAYTAYSNGDEFYSLIVYVCGQTHDVALPDPRVQFYGTASFLPDGHTIIMSALWNSGDIGLATYDISIGKGACITRCESN